MQRQTMPRDVLRAHTGTEGQTVLCEHGWRGQGGRELPPPLSLERGVRNGEVSAAARAGGRAKAGGARSRLAPPGPMPRQDGAKGGSRAGGTGS